MRIFFSIVVIALLAADTAAEQTFEADAALAARAATSAEELVRFAAAQFDVELDWSDESIEKIDPMLDQIHQTYLDEQPAEHEILPVAQAFGSYIGEVYRRNHDGTWGWISDGESVFAGLRQSNGAYFWPSARTLDRIKTNEEPSISDYYHFLVIR